MVTNESCGLTVSGIKTLTVSQTQSQTYVLVSLNPQSKLARILFKGEEKKTLQMRKSEAFRG
jgi:hypothetical protein